ncbi:unnamed protein product, partial [marine sediment metagenome]
ANTYKLRHHCHSAGEGLSEETLLPTTIDGQTAAVTPFEVSIIDDFRGETKTAPWAPVLARNTIRGM